MTDDFDLSTGLPSSDMEAYLQLFLDETSEQLDALVDSLLLLEQEPDNGLQLNEGFRLIHCIKGSAAMMGLESITILTHRLENHFERLRSGLDTLHPEMMALILKCIDFLRQCNEQLRRGQPLTSAPELLDELDRLSAATPPDAASRAADKRAATTADKEPVTSTPRESSTAHAPPGEEEAEPPAPISAQPVDESETEPAARVGKFRISVRLEPELPLSDVKAELICNRLTELGTVLATRPSPGEFHRLEETPLLQLVVESERSAGELRSAADVDGVASMEVEEGIEDLSAWPVTDEAPVLQKEPPAASEPADAAGEEAARPAATVPDVPAASVADTQASTAGEVQESRSLVAETLRVDVDRLDHLMNLAGELVVNQARFVQIARQMGPAFKKGNVATRARSLAERLQQLASDQQPGGADLAQTGRLAWSRELDELEVEIGALEEQAQLWEASRRQFGQMTEAIDQLARVSKSLQRAVLDTRMVPVAPLFNRFRRVVRDISSELGKQVTLEICGEKTELDKRMIDELNDPLVHLVRNAIDHGIESREVRQRSGKPAMGVVRLEAAHSGNNVFITVSDDGGGIHVDRVRERIVQRGIVSLAAMEQMPDEQVIEYIWHPGFSTAAVVSGISGRGVGMDIVKTRIAGLNGTVAIGHSPGQGTRFTIRLPLTLAIIRSLLFRLRDGVFAVALENVREIVAVPPGKIVSVFGKRTFDVRGTFIPLVDIDDIFDWHDPRRVDGSDRKATGIGAGEKLVNVVILHSGNRTLGLQVEELLGGQDIVIKSLAENFVQTRGLSGASILGDGSVCLLLDVGAAIDLASRNRTAGRGSGRSTGSA
jgi:two-component system, chemotaxis family, sensor kinase CheA